MVNTTGLCLFITLLGKVTALNLDSIDKNSYGPYEFSVTHFSICERKDLFGNYSTKLVDNKIVYVNISVLRPCTLSKTKSRISIFRHQGDRRELVLSYQLRDPCDHFALSAILHSLYNMTKECVIERGNYTMKFNMVDYNKLFMGPKFFYGEFLFKTSLRCTKGTFACLDSTAVIEKKKT